MRTLAAVLLFSATLLAGDAEVRYLRAWHAAEDPERVDEAAEAFRALAEDPATPPELRLRCELGLARCARTDGRAHAARALLLPLAEAEEAGGVRAEARRMLGPDRWFGGIRVVPAGRFLDLDNGGIFPRRAGHPGGAAEVRGETILARHDEDAAFAELAPAASGRPWRRVRTNEGRTSWVQILRRQPAPIVRFFTRAGGWGAPLPAVRDALCVGRGGVIEVRFTTDPRFVRYRVERRVGPGDAWRESALVEGGLHEDVDAPVDAILGYRVTGIDADGREGLPAVVQGTIASRGVRRGEATLNVRRGRAFSFLLGRTVDAGGAHWDLYLQHAWQQQAGFHNHYGHFVAATTERGAAARSPWDASTATGFQIKTGESFLVPLRGGGVARCRLVSPPQSRNVASIEYEVYGDADVFPAPPEVTAERTGDGEVVVRARAQPPWFVPEVRVRELRTGQGPWRLALGDDGRAVDERAAPEQVREYAAVAVDRWGRRSPSGSTRINLMTPGPREGSFEFHWQQGYSFELGRIVPWNEADVYFQVLQRRTGQIALATTDGPGVRHLGGVLQWPDEPGARRRLFDTVTGVVEDELALEGVAMSLPKQPASEIWIVRTRHGGWVKLEMISAENGRWQTRNVKFRFVFNPREPVFRENPGAVETRAGVVFAGLERVERALGMRGRWAARFRELVRDEAFRAALLETRRAGGTIGDPRTRHEVLTDERDASAGLYSFVLARRGPPPGHAGRYLWDLRYFGGRLIVRQGVADASTIVDLGRRTWAEVAAAKAPLLDWNQGDAGVRLGHVYLVRKRGGDLHVPTLVRVRGCEPGRRVDLEWVSLQGGVLRVSAGLELGGDTRAALTAALAALPEGAAAHRAAFAGTEAAYGTWRLLHETVVEGAVRNRTAKDLGADLASIAGVRVIVGDGLDGAVSFLHDRSVADLLHDLASRYGWPWSVTDSGALRIGR